MRAEEGAVGEERFGLWLSGFVRPEVSTGIGEPGLVEEEQGGLLTSDARIDFARVFSQQGVAEDNRIFAGLGGI
jgi:hypothetical protein